MRLSDKGTWSTSSGVLNVDTLDGTDNEAVLLATTPIDLATLEAAVKFPTSSSTNRSGIVFAHDGNDVFHVVVLDRNAGKVALHKVTSGSWGSVLASASQSISDNTAYTLTLMVRPRRVDVFVDGALSFGHDFSAFAYPGQGESGLYSDKTSVKYDDYRV